MDNVESGRSRGIQFDIDCPFTYCQRAACLTDDLRSRVAGIHLYYGENTGFSFSFDTCRHVPLIGICFSRFHGGGVGIDEKPVGQRHADGVVAEQLGHDSVAGFIIGMVDCK